MNRHQFILFSFIFLLILCQESFANHMVELMEIFIHGKQVRFFPNVSLGLDIPEENGYQCKSNSDLKSFPSVMGYNPNRRLQNQTLEEGKQGLLQLGFVLALGGHSHSHYNFGPAGSLNGIMAIWDSWIDNFFSVTSNTTSLILILDERDFNRQNITSSKSEYLDRIIINNMGAKPVDCVQLQRRHPGSNQIQIAHPHLHSNRVSGNKMSEGCSNELVLDQGYRVYYIDTQSLHPNLPSSSQPLIIFAGIRTFPAPSWAKGKDEEELFQNWRLPGRMSRFKTNYGYVKMTNWYALHMITLRLLDFFDYAGKLDNDVSFVSPFPEPNLPNLLAQGGYKMLMTEKDWYFDEPRIAQGIRQCLQVYTEEQKGKCENTHSLSLSSSGSVSLPTASPSLSPLVPRGYESHSLFWESNLNATFRAHFLVYWLGLYTAPETLSLARSWNDWYKGMWEYRWGDQQWWPRPMAMYSEGNLSSDILHYDLIDTANEKFVVHKQWPRYGTLAKGRYFRLDEGSNRTYREEVYNTESKAFIY